MTAEESSLDVYADIYREARRRLAEQGGLPATRRPDRRYYTERVLGYRLDAPDQPLPDGAHLARMRKILEGVPFELLGSVEGWDVALRFSAAYETAIDLDDEEAEREQAEREQAGLPPEVSTDEAASILRVSKDTVLAYRAAGRLPYRDVAAPGSSRPVYRFPREAVVALRTAYETAEPPAAPRPEEPQRRRVRGERTYKHLRTKFKDG